MKKFFKISGYIFLLFLFVGSIAAGYIFYKGSSRIHDLKKMKNYSPSLITNLYDMNGELIAEFYIEKRILRKITEIPELMKMATMAIEDDNFYRHNGVDLLGIARAAVVNLKAGGIVQGGSTITQQVAKLLFLSRERTFTRKFNELFLSLEIEKNFSKAEILEIYLNQIYYGHGAYGVEAAAQHFFEKTIAELSTSEMALLAGIPKSPNHFSPYKNPRAALKRRNLVIRRMMDLGFISAKDGNVALSESLSLAPKKSALNYAPFFSEHVRRYIEKKYGSETLYHSGLKIYTTLNLEWQKQAQKSLKDGIEIADRRLGYRGPIGWQDPEKEADWKKLNPTIETTSEFEWFTENRRLKGIVLEVAKESITFEINGSKQSIEPNGFAWAHEVDPKKDGKAFKKIKDANDIGLKRGDIIEVRAVENRKTKTVEYHLDQFPAVQGAILSLDYKNGATRSMVGGYDFTKSSFNRSVQARRQPGSSFKPIIYSAAIDKGITPATIVIDSPIIYEDDIGEYKNWKPVNFNQKFFGPTTVRSAVTHSRNIVTIKLLEKIGIKYVVEYAKRLGIESPLDENLSLALGASSVTLKEIVSSYGIFPNKGVSNEPYFIERIEDADGKILEEHQPSPFDAIPESTAYIITSILQSVVKEGTGAAVRSVGVPTGGKTGTTNNYMDAWFVGFTPGIVCGVWIGKDKEERLGKYETGSRTAAPIWREYMKRVVKDTPITPFTPPNDIVFVRTDKVTGALATPDNPNSFFELYRENELPLSELPESYEPPEPLS